MKKMLAILTMVALSSFVGIAVAAEENPATAKHEAAATAHEQAAKL